MDRIASEVTQGTIRAHPDGSARSRRWQAWFIVAIAVTIAVCEYVFTYQNVAYGIVIALVLAMVIYFVLSALRFDENIASCAESLALIPLYILFTSSLPWFFINQQYLLPAVYSCILVLCLWYVYSHKLNLKQIFNISKQKVLKYILIGTFIGIPLGVAEYFVLRPAAAFPTFELQYFLRDFAYMLLFVGLGEELLFRGLIQQDLVKAFGWRWGLFGASFLFTVMHLTWRSIAELGFVFIAALFLGGLYLKTKSLLAPIMAHAVGNVLLVAVMPYLFGK
ncbi:MAG: CPBP family intramembrane metalloprotease [Dehalococcoidia bacterium]|nr:MAG: CPBP family intramembrane metalloprotease [Dehalococcoidia bacterium]